MIRGERCKDMNDHLSYVQQHARGHLSSHAWQPGGGGEEQGRGWGCGAGLGVGFWGVFGLGVPKTVLKFLI